MVGIMERLEVRMDTWIRQQAAEAGQFAHAAEMMNVLLQRLVANFGSVVYGRVLAEGNWETEDEAEGSEYKTDASVEVETGSEEELEESGEEKEKK